MLSVALCTYNGEPFLAEQLQSILQQTCPVDEIVICDDGSTDSTVSIAETFRQSHPNKIRIYQNKEPLGVCLNFKQATSLCKGSIIFFSDQDDVWQSNKVEYITDYLSKRPNIAAVFTDALLIDSQSRHLKHYGNLFRMSFHKEEQRMFDAGLQLECFLRRNHTTGATMAVRSSFLESHHPFDFCTPHFLHDFAIAIKAAEDGRLGVIYQPLINYRRHDNQQTGFYLPSAHEGENWHCYYDHIREYWPASEHLQSVMPIISSLSRERVEYIITRNRLLHKSLALFIILRTRKKYKHLYGDNYLKIMCYDIRQSLRYTFLRLTRRTPKK